MKTRIENWVLLSALIACFGLILLGPHAFADGGVPLWTNRYNAPAVGGYVNDFAVAIAVDGSGNVFVTGSSGYDYATIKYSGTGVPLWTNRYDGLVGDGGGATAVAVDGGGNVLVTGYSYDPVSYRAYATIKYSNAGVPLWTNRYTGPGNDDDVAKAMAVDGSGNVFVTGVSRGFGSGYDYATIKYSGAGVPLWTNRYNGPANNEDSAYAVAVDGSGNVFVTGYSFGIDSYWDYATLAYSSAGVPLWTNRYNDPANNYDIAYAVAVDGNGDVFVTGGPATIKYSGAGVPLWTDLSGDGGNALAVDNSGNVFVMGSGIGSTGNLDYSTIKYSSAGVPLWTNRYNGPGNGIDTANAIAVDSSGNVFVAGTSWNGTNSDCTTIAYSNGGVSLWTNRYNKAANENAKARAVTVDLNGNVFVTGHSYTSDGSNLGYVTIKYSSSVPTPPRLDFQSLNNQLVLTWANATFGLQSAPAVTGTFTNISSATSPYTNPITGAQKFYRLSQ